MAIGSLARVKYALLGKTFLYELQSRSENPIALTFIVRGDASRIRSDNHHPVPTPIRKLYRADGAVHVGRQPSWEPPTLWDIHFSASRTLLRFFIKPKLKPDKSIGYVGHPLILCPPFGLEQRLHQSIDAQIKVFNRGHSRAEGCRARLIFHDTKSGDALPIDCTWPPNEGKITSIPASLFPTILTLFKFDPLTHHLLSDDPQRYLVIAPSVYRLTLTLDAEGLDSTEIDLGTIQFPDDLFSSKHVTDYYKRLCGKLGYALFLGVTQDYRVVAKVIGEVPSKRLSALKRQYQWREMERA